MPPCPAPPELPLRSPFRVPPQAWMEARPGLVSVLQRGPPDTLLKGVKITRLGLSPAEGISGVLFAGAAGSVWGAVQADRWPSGVQGRACSWRPSALPGH